MINSGGGIIFLVICMLFLNYLLYSKAHGFRKRSNFPIWYCYSQKWMALTSLFWGKWKCMCDACTWDALWHSSVCYEVFIMKYCIFRTLKYFAHWSRKWLRKMWGVSETTRKQGESALDPWSLTLAFSSFYFDFLLLMIEEERCKIYKNTQTESVTFSV